MNTQQATLEVADQVRNIKTRLVGTIQEIHGENAEILVSSDGELLMTRVECRLQDLEKLNQAEYELIMKLVKAREKKKALAAELEAASSEAATAEDEMIEYFRTHELQSTAPYEGFGKVEIDGMKVMARINIADQEEAFAEIEKMGRGDIIKRSVHPSTLNTFVNELLDNGSRVPEKIGYFLKPKLSFKKK